MHGHYLLKLIASLAQVRKMPLYSTRQMLEHHGGEPSL